MQGQHGEEVSAYQKGYQECLKLFREQGVSPVLTPDVMRTLLRARATPGSLPGTPLIATGGPGTPGLPVTPLIATGGPSLPGTPGLPGTPLIALGTPIKGSHPGTPLAGPAGTPGLPGTPLIATGTGLFGTPAKGSQPGTPNTGPVGTPVLPGTPLVGTGTPAKGSLPVIPGLLSTPLGTPLKGSLPGTPTAGTLGTPTQPGTPIARGEGLPGPAGTNRSPPGAHNPLPGPGTPNPRPGTALNRSHPSTPQAVVGTPTRGGIPDTPNPGPGAGLPITAPGIVGPMNPTNGSLPGTPQAGGTPTRPSHPGTTGPNTPRMGPGIGGTPVRVNLPTTPVLRGIPITATPGTNPGTPMRSNSLPGTPTNVLVRSRNPGVPTSSRGSQPATPVRGSLAITPVRGMALPQARNPMGTPPIRSLPGSPLGTPQMGLFRGVVRSPQDAAQSPFILIPSPSGTPTGSPGHTLSPLVSPRGVVTGFPGPDTVRLPPPVVTGFPGPTSTPTLGIPTPPSAPPKNPGGVSPTHTPPSTVVLSVPQGTITIKEEPVEKVQVVSIPAALEQAKPSPAIPTLQEAKKPPSIPTSVLQAPKVEPSNGIRFRGAQETSQPIRSQDQSAIRFTMLNERATVNTVKDAGYSVITLPHGNPRHTSTTAAMETTTTTKVQPPPAMVRQHTAPATVPSEQTFSSEHTQQSSAASSTQGATTTSRVSSPPPLDMADSSPLLQLATAALSQERQTVLPPPVHLTRSQTLPEHPAWTGSTRHNTRGHYRSRSSRGGDLHLDNESDGSRSPSRVTSRGKNFRCSELNFLCEGLDKASWVSTVVLLFQWYTSTGTEKKLCMRCLCDKMCSPGFWSRAEPDPKSDVSVQSLQRVICPTCSPQKPQL